MHCIFSHSCFLRHRYSLQLTKKTHIFDKCTPQSLCHCVWGESLSSQVISAYPLVPCLAGEHTSLWARSPEAGSTERRKIPQKIHGSREEFGVFCFPGGVPSSSLACDFAMDFGKAGWRSRSRHVVEGGRSPRRKQSLDASSRSSLEDETRGPGLPGVIPTGSQNPCTHRVSEF